mgnify:CR=1 FL=1
MRVEVVVLFPRTFATGVTMIVMVPSTKAFSMLAVAAVLIHLKYATTWITTVMVPSTKGSQWIVMNANSGNRNVAMG